MKNNFFPDFRYGAAFLSCLGLTVASDAAVRDVDLLNDSRVSGKFDQRMRDQVRGVRAAGTREGLEMSVMASMIYDDNIFRSSESAEEDLVTSIVPRVSYTLGKPEGRTWVRAIYSGDVVIYLENNDDSRVDHRVEVEAGMRKKMLKFAYAGSWAKLGNPDADTGGSPDRMEWRNRVAMGWEPRGKTSGEIFAERSVVEQDSNFLNDVEENAAGLSLSYRYSPKTQLGMTYTVGQVDVDNASVQDFQRITGSVAWQPRRKISVFVEGGAEYRDFGSGKTSWEPVVSGRVSWAPRQGTELYFTGYHRQEASAFFDNQNFTVTGGIVGVSQRIHRGWAGRLEIGWEDSDYFATAKGVSAGRSDSSVFIRPTLAYSSETGHSLQFFYQWSDSDSSDADFGYSNQEIGVSIECEF